MSQWSFDAPVSHHKPMSLLLPAQPSASLITFPPDVAGTFPKLILAGLIPVRFYSF